MNLIIFLETFIHQIRDQFIETQLQIILKILYVINCPLMTDFQILFEIMHLVIDGFPLIALDKVIIDKMLQFQKIAFARLNTNVFIEMPNSFPNLVDDFQKHINLIHIFFNLW